MSMCLERRRVVSIQFINDRSDNVHTQHRSYDTLSHTDGRMPNEQCRLYHSHPPVVFQMIQVYQR